MANLRGYCFPCTERNVKKWRKLELLIFVGEQLVTAADSARCRIRKQRRDIWQLASPMLLLSAS